MNWRPKFSFRSAIQQIRTRVLKVRPIAALRERLGRVYREIEDEPLTLTTLLAERRRQHRDTLIALPGNQDIPQSAFEPYPAGYMTRKYTYTVEVAGHDLDRGGMPVVIYRSVSSDQVLSPDEVMDIIRIRLAAEHHTTDRLIPEIITMESAYRETPLPFSQ